MKEKAINIIAAIIAIMFFYAIVIKMRNYDAALHDMYNQVFSKQVAKTLTWLIPCFEAIIILLLLYKKTTKGGLWATIMLLATFSIYIQLATHKFFDRLPCNCGGILWRNSSYSHQLWFNIAFIFLATIGLLLYGNAFAKARQFIKKRKRQIQFDEPPV